MRADIVILLGGTRAASKERNQSHVYIHQIGKEEEEEKVKGYLKLL